MPRKGGKEYRTAHGPHRIASWEEGELQSAALRLGPFSPPKRFDHGREFDPPVPRPISIEVRTGPVERMRRRWTVFQVATGLVFLLASRTAFVQEAAQFVLVLRALPYLGIASLVLAGVRALYRTLRPGVFAYVRDGEPMVGRVLTVGSIALHPGDAMNQFIFAAGVEYDDPDTGAHVFATLRSERLSPLGSSESFDLAISPGDYVTVLGIPGRFSKTARLYGFLSLSADRMFVRKKGRPIVPNVAGSSLAMVAMSALLMFVVLPLFLYVADRFDPVEDAGNVWALGVGIGAVIGVVLAILGIWRTEWFEGTRTSQAAIVFGLAMFGAVAGFFGTNLANAAFDTSAPEYRDIEVKEFVQETFYPVLIRKYLINYQGVGNRIGGKFYARLDLIADFQQTQLGVAEVGSGAFGLKWVRRLHPLVVNFVGARGAVDDQSLVVVIPDDSGERIQLIVEPELRRPDGEMLPVSDRLLRRLRYRLKEDGFDVHTVPDVDREGAIVPKPVD